MLLVLALVCTLLGLAADVVGAMLIYRGVKYAARNMFELIFESSSKLFDDTGHTSALESAMRAESLAKSELKASFRGVCFFVLGFVLQTTGAVLVFVYGVE